MASSPATLISLGFFLVFTASLQKTLGGDVVCEDLPAGSCAFAIAASGKRCLLEKFGSGDKVELQCKTSEAVVEGLANYLETDACVSACGVDRNSVGISSDALLESHFTDHLCSPACYQKCPNIVDLFFNLAAGEGVYLPRVCEAQRANNSPRRMMAVLSSGAAAGPVSADVSELAAAPGPSGGFHVSELAADAPAPTISF